MAKQISGPPWVRSIRQLSLIVLAATAVALISNHFRTSPLPLVGDWSQEGRLLSPSGRQLAVSLKESEKLYQSKSAVFMDARPMEEFIKGHIDGAINLPWEAHSEERAVEATADLKNDAAIITYCDGETCDLSKELAIFLENLGFTNVRVLVNGWTLWHDAGLPVSTGEGN